MIVHWKRLFNNKGGKGYTAKRNDRNMGLADPIFPTDFGCDPNLFYANVQNGLIMFSSNSQCWNYVRLVYNGMGGTIGEEPMVPRIFRTAIVDYVAECAFRYLVAKEPRIYRVMQMDAFNRLYTSYTGSWEKAERRAKKADTWKKDEIREWNAHKIG